MGDPYLSSDESLILSAHGISIDDLPLDLMLTSRRLILIDNSVTPFQLHTIPLETIITVFAGTDAKGEPIITLSHMGITGTGAPHPMDIIFNRQKGEPRVKECNEWAATLNDQASRARDDALAAGTLPYDPVKVIQPRMSATYRIETFSPHRPAAGEYPVKVEPAPLPPVPKLESEDWMPADVDTPSPPAEAEWVEPSESEPSEPPAREETVLPGAEIIGAGEFLNSLEVTDAVTLSVDTVQPEDELAEEIPAAYEEVSVRTPVPPISGTPPEQNPEPGTDTACAEPPVESTEIPGLSDAQRIWADAARSIVSPAPLIPASVDENSACLGNPAADETKSAVAESGIIPEKPAEERSESITPAESVVLESSPIHEPIESYPPQSPQKTDTEIAVHPVADSFPVQKNQKRSSSSILITAIVIVILVVLGGAIIGSTHLIDSPETSPPVVVPVITAWPTPTPVSTLVPAEGVWVRIEYPGIFIGEVGNPERMHPVYGSGVQLYKVVTNDPILKASAQKQDNSGDTLIIEIYSNGTLIKRSSTRIPMGSVDILIDPLTGKPPGIEWGDIP